MAINDVTSIDVKTLPPFKKLIMTIGELPTSYLESMSYAELLMWFCNFLQNKVLPTINNNADALQDVITYLEDLDLQDEVNNKLDEMAESGQLQEIVAEYLNANALWCFDDVADMKSAPNLIAGSYAKTLGYHTKNDGGTATYKIREITNADTVDESYIIALDNNELIAELVIADKKISLLQLGCDPTGTTDCTNILYKTIKNLKDGGEIYIPTGTYKTSTLNIDFEVSNLTIKGQGFNSCLNNNGNDWTINFQKHIVNILFENFAIWCNNTAKGIKTTKDSNQVNVRFRMNYFNIRNTTNGLYLDNVAYCELNNTQIGVCNSSSNNYAMILNGLEYNTFDTSSFNADTNGSTFPLVIIKNSNCDTFTNCEFAKSDIGIKIDSTNSNNTLRNITIDKCKFAFMSKSVYGYINTKSIANLKIINNIMYVTGNSANDRPILFERLSGSTQSLNNVIIENNAFNKETGTSPTYCIECLETMLNYCSILNNRSYFNNNNYLNIGSNVPVQFSDMNSSLIRSANITANGSTTEFTIYNNNNELPIIVNKPPYFICNIPDLGIPYSVRTYYENGVQLRAKINFATAPASGTYAINYSIRY